MGIKQIELVPIANQISPITPASKNVRTKAFQIARTDTVASIKMALPQGATILNIFVYSPLVSNALTTATVSIGTSVTATELITSLDVKTAAGIIQAGAGAATTFLQIEPVPTTGVDLNIWAKYAETGTASTTGGPYTVFVLFVP